MARSFSTATPRRQTDPPITARERKNDSTDCAQRRVSANAGGRQAQLLRLRIDDKFAFSPEISANKYAINIRFASISGPRRNTSDEDIDFELTFCNV